MYPLYSQPRYFKFKRKYQQYGPCFQTLFPFVMTMSMSYLFIKMSSLHYSNSFFFFLDLCFFPMGWETMKTELDKTCIQSFAPAFIAYLYVWFLFYPKWINFIDWVKEVFYERKVWGELMRCFFPLQTGVAPHIYVPTTSFKLMALRNIKVEKALLSKVASVTMKQMLIWKCKKEKT